MAVVQIVQQARKRCPSLTNSVSARLFTVNKSVVSADNSVASFRHNASTASFTGVTHATTDKIVSNSLSVILILESRSISDFRMQFFNFMICSSIVCKLLQRVLESSISENDLPNSTAFRAFYHFLSENGETILQRNAP
jgi:hypothetical protein